MNSQPTSKELSHRDALMHIRERAFRLAKINCPDTCSEWEHPLCWIARTADKALRTAPEPPPEQPSVTDIIRQMRGRAAASDAGGTIEVLLTDLRCVVTGMQQAASSQPPCSECQRMREGLQLMATDEHRLMNITARNMAQSILNGKPSGISALPPPVDEPSVMGGAVHPIPPPPAGVDRIEWHVREIQKICDALNLDPVQWLMPDLENDVPEGPSPTKGAANE